MQLLPIQTSILSNGDNLASIFSSNISIQSGDILVVSSKVVALTEGTSIDLTSMKPSKKAEEYSHACGRSPAFCQAVIQEMIRMNGSVINTCPGALLTELRPSGMEVGTILTANAGLDESNVEKNTAIGWPMDPAASAKKLRTKIEQSMNGKIAVIISDSCCHPRRLGVTAFALAVSGIDPLISQNGKKDIHGKPLHITTEAIADQLATAANMLMGNAGQMIPACIVRDHGFNLSAWTGWVEGIEKEQDLFPM
ncbi:MAG: coenzyme F420-0:L-glutamate ligase [Candidatus Peribacteraceae bacterium]|nr:coenzyme F420-0:L-glutamate ligase [Candidatus Peribacteraceae bacterium]